MGLSVRVLMGMHVCVCACLLDLTHPAFAAVLAAMLKAAVDGRDTGGAMREAMAVEESESEEEHEEEEDREESGSGVSREPEAGLQWSQQGRRQRGVRARLSVPGPSPSRLQRVTHSMPLPPAVKLPYPTTTVAQTLSVPRNHVQLTSCCKTWMSILGC